MLNISYIFIHAVYIFAIQMYTHYVYVYTAVRGMHNSCEQV